mgnify:CR=1 FL=1
MSVIIFAAKLMKGTVIAQLFSIALLPIVTRIYSQESIGVLYLITNCIVMYIPIAFLRADQMIINNVVTQQKKTLFLYSIILMSISALFFSLIYGFLVFGVEWHSVWAWLALTLVLLASAIFHLLRCHYLSILNPDMVSKLQIVKTTSRYFLFIILGYFYSTYAVLIFSEIISFIIPVALLMCRYRSAPIKSIRQTVDNLKWYGLVDFLKKNKNYTLHDSLSAFFNSLLFSITLPVAMVLYSASSVALYGLALQLVSIPNYHAGKALSDSFQVFASANILKPGRIVNEFDVLTLKLVAISSGIYGAGYYLSDWLVVLIFSSEWVGLAEIIKVLCPMMGMALVSAPSSRVLAVIGKGGDKAIVDGVTLILVIFASFYVYHNGIPFISFVFIVSLIRSISYMLNLILARYHLLNMRAYNE